MDEWPRVTNSTHSGAVLGDVVVTDGAREGVFVALVYEPFSRRYFTVEGGRVCGTAGLLTYSSGRLCAGSSSELGPPYNIYNLFTNRYRECLLFSVVAMARITRMSDVRNVFCRPHLDNCFG